MDVGGVEQKVKMRRSENNTKKKKIRRKRKNKEKKIAIGEIVLLRRQSEVIHMTALFYIEYLICR